MWVMVVGVGLLFRMCVCLLRVGGVGRMYDRVGVVVSRRVYLVVVILVMLVGLVVMFQPFVRFPRAVPLLFRF